MSFVPEPIDVATWPAIFRLLQPALERGGDCSAQELIDDLIESRAQLWVLRTKGGDPKAAAVTQRYGSLLHCQLLGGENMAEWVDDLIATTAHYAKPVGVERFTIEGRPGWERILTPRGWRKRAVVMEISL
jgi:hypothetical protein